MNSLNQSYDSIVIGSGIGGLAAASLLSVVGKQKVLVLERHSCFGGLSQSLSHGGYTWDLGVQYVGEVDPGSPTRGLFDLATGGAVDWLALSECYDVFEYPDDVFRTSSRQTQLLSTLTAAFPEERTALVQYFKDIRKAHRWFVHYVAAAFMPALVARLFLRSGRRLALLRTKDYVDEHFRNQRLKAILTSQDWNHGVPPAESAFAAHALMAEHFLRGAYFPRGGARSITGAMIDTVERAGGACLVNHEVIEIVLQGNRAVGVRMRRRENGSESESTIRCSHVISGVGSSLTNRLLPSSHCIPAQPAGGFSPTSVVVLCIGLRRSPVELGFTGENHFIFTSYDHGDMFANRGALLQGKPTMAFLSFPSLKNPVPSNHTAQIIAKIDYECFSGLADPEALNQQITDALIALVERRHPGFSALVEYSQVITPRTIEALTGHERGLIYGSRPPIPLKFLQPNRSPRTPVKHLLLAGADACASGVVGAFFGGLIAAGSILGPIGLGMLRILAAQRRHRRLLEGRPAHVLTSGPSCSATGKDTNYSLRQNH